MTFNDLETAVDGGIGPPDLANLAYGTRRIQVRSTFKARHETKLLPSWLQAQPGKVDLGAQVCFPEP